MRISFIGGGNIASALLTGLAKKRIPDLSLHVVDRNLEKGQRLVAQTQAGYSTVLSKTDVLADLIVLAIKPAQLHSIAAQIAPWLQQQCIVSVASGIRTATLSSWLGHYPRVVWMMPNTPAQVGEAMTAAYAMEEVSAATREQVQLLMSAIGEFLWLSDESQMDGLAAISGCGPAYVFYFIEALQAAATQFGFAEETARHLAYRSFSGALALLSQTGLSPQQLRAQVTSKNGMTERAIAYFEQQDLKECIANAAASAAERSTEMAKQYVP